MRVFISTGEVSGDMQGSFLVDALHRQAEIRKIELEVVALGGKRIEEAGATLIADTTALGSMGLVEALPFVLPIQRIHRQVKQIMADHPPDILILIDYQGVNLKVAENLRQLFPNLPVVYYIAPHQWVWSPIKSDITRLTTVTDRVLAIFPEEARFYRRQGLKVDWVGHPLIDKMQNVPTKAEAREALSIDPDATIITLLPASRRQELKYLLPVIFTAARQLQDKLEAVKFLIPLSLEVFRSTIEFAIAQYGLNAKIITQDTLTAMAAADLAITKSGTANLEIALLNVPQVVMYRVNPITIWIARKLFKMSIPFISPVNLVPMKPIVPELLQEEATPQRLVQESLDLLLNPDRREAIVAGYQEMRDLLGEVGVRDRAANLILDFAQGSHHPLRVKLK
jgi:lipid-A-disaccharide synthase